MGCTSSKNDSGDVNPRVFKVFNVDEQGQELNPGKIEITDTDLLLVQKGKDIMRWPLRCLRRYGFDQELFSFESGRRCPTGPGIFAFKCRRAEALFNLLQEYIQRAGQEDQLQRNTIIENGSRPNSVIEISHHVTNGNVVSNGHITLPASNNNAVHYYNINSITEGQQRAAQEHDYVNTGIAIVNGAIIDPGSVQVVDMRSAEDNRPTEPEGKTLNYAILDLPQSNENISELSRRKTNGNSKTNSSTATYVNVENVLNGIANKNGRCSVVRQQSVDHNYENLDLLSTSTPPRIHDGVPLRMRKGVTNIQFDADRLNNLPTGANPSPTSPVSLTSSGGSPGRRTESYALIDFHKTAALSAKCNNNEDDCSRKTRHNSTISALQ